MFGFDRMNSRSKQPLIELTQYRFGDQEENGLHFLTRASFTEAPAKTESKGFQTFISRL